MKHKILPVVVIYRCQLDEAIAYQTLVKRKGLTEFVVYDNSPADYCQKEGMIPDTAHYFHDVNNGGLSRAYNYGAKIARERGFSWLLLLDQDTSFPEGAYDAYEEATDKKGMVVPNVVLSDGRAFSPCVSRLSGIAPVNLKEGRYSLYDYCAINSGCCVPVDLFFAAGGYKEDVRLDFSDFQFQHRLRKVNPDFYVIPLVATQDFSNDETNVDKLLTRFKIYLEGANSCELEGCREKTMQHIHVLKHTLALTLRTKHFNFIYQYLKKYLLNL